VDPVELAAQVAVTEGFIATRPVTLTLTPIEKVADGKGGTKRVPADPRTPQVMRFIESGSLRADLRTTDTGEQWTQDAVLLAMPDAAIAVNDEFEWDGSTWHVEEVLFPNGYEVRATVLRHGR